MTGKTSYLFLILLFIHLNLNCSAQTQYSFLQIVPDSINHSRLKGVLLVQGGLYVASLSGLYLAWYRDYPQSSFHFFNDNGEWQQMDKLGHATTAAYISRFGYLSYRWTGLDEKRSAWYGSLLSFAYLLNIEILDGFSTGWGFSPGDLAANTIGSGLFLAQQLGWHQQKILLKFSFHTTDYAKIRPDVLGDNLVLQTLKDYNGQTYWLSGNIKSFLPENVKFPGWLNVAVGYGAGGMVGSTGNYSLSGQSTSAFKPYRKFFLSFDVDLSRIPVKSPVLKALFNVINFIKIPAPAIEFNSLDQCKFYGIYY